MNPTPSTQHPEPTTPEIPVYCDCCPHRPKKMAVLQPDAVQIISRRSGKKHIARIPLSPIIKGAFWNQQSPSPQNPPHPFSLPSR